MVPETLSLLPLLLNNLLKSSLLAMTPMNTTERIEDIYPRADERVYAKWVHSTTSIHYRFVITVHLRKCWISCVLVSIIWIEMILVGVKLMMRVLHSRIVYLCLEQHYLTIHCIC